MKESRRNVGTIKEEYVDPDVKALIESERYDRYDDPNVAIFEVDKFEDTIGREVRDIYGHDGVIISDLPEGESDLSIREFYSDEKLLDQMATELLDIAGLGSEVPSVAAPESELMDYGAMIMDLLEARTKEEYRFVLSAYGYLGRLESVVNYVDYKMAACQ